VKQLCIARGRPERDAKYLCGLSARQLGIGGRVQRSDPASRKQPHSQKSIASDSWTARARASARAIGWCLCVMELSNFLFNSSVQTLANQSNWERENPSLFAGGVSY
jgi:hypothetical protein